VIERKISLPRRLYRSFIRVHGPSLGLIALALAFVPMFFTSNTQVAVSWLILASVLGLFVAIVLFDAVYELHGKSSAILPRVLTSIETPTIYKNVQRILLLEPSEIFGTESLISFYLEENGLEILFGVGYVATIQDNGNIQAAITRVLGPHEETFSKIKNNDVNVLKKILVKPSMPSSLVE
jgi:hypothetical protein